MRTNLLSFLVATVALVEVGASPIRLIVVSSNQESTPKLRFGHAVAHHNLDTNGQTVHLPTMVMPTHDIGKAKGGCRGARLRQKALEISNAFRQALGLPLIEDHSVHPSKFQRPDGEFHILPFIGTPPTLVRPPMPFSDMGRGHGDQGKVVFMPHPHPHHRPEPTFRRVGREPFTRRLHFALTALGPWEGRAVAFVLGCGIGVLLRMLWVLAVVSYRLVKGTKEDENKYAEIILVEEYDNADDIIAAPPTYTYVDEKQDKDAAVLANTTEQTK